MVGSLVMVQWQWMAKILCVEQEFVHLAEKDENELYLILILFLLFQRDWESVQKRETSLVRSVS